MWRPTVLVVDDDREIRNVLDDVLASEHYSVFVAANARDAVDMLRFGVKPTVVILDLMMPVSNGFDFLEERRKDPALNFPVIVLTASSSYSAAELGVEALLRKPVDMKTMIETIERLANERAESDAGQV